MEKDPLPVDIPADLRPVVLAAAKNLAHLLYGPAGPPWGTSFASLEELSVQISRLLGSELLRQAVDRQSQQSPPQQLHACPGCQGPLEDKPPEPRSLRTRQGTADWQEPARYCRRCRRDFFPSVAVPGHRPD